MCKYIHRDACTEKGFQVTSEGGALILNKNSTEIRFDERMRQIISTDYQVLQELKRSRSFVPLEVETGR